MKDIHLAAAETLTCTGKMFHEEDHIVIRVEVKRYEWRWRRGALNYKNLKLLNNLSLFYPIGSYKIVAKLQSSRHSANLVEHHDHFVFE